MTFVPSADDIAYGNLVRRHWISLATNGTAGDDWYPASQSSSVVNTGVLGASPYSGVLANVVDFKVQLCQQLEALGFDSRFWWLN